MHGYICISPTRTYHGVEVGMLHGLHGGQPLLVVVPRAQICQHISPKAFWVTCREHLSSLSRKSRVSGDTKCWFSLCTNLERNHIYQLPRMSLKITSPISFYCVCPGCRRSADPAQFGTCQGTRTVPLFQAPFAQLSFSCRLSGYWYSSSAPRTK